MSSAPAKLDPPCSAYASLPENFYTRVQTSLRLRDTDFEIGTLEMAAAPTDP
jgi:hypothetical protein